MDYGIAKALSGFVSSGDAKAQRNQEFQLLQNMYEQQQRQANQEAAYNQDMVAYTEKVTELAQEITSGVGMREEDREAYKMLTEEATALLKEDISRAGSITKFLQAGGAQKLADYKNTIVGSDIALRLKKNQAVFEKLIDASQGENADKTAHLIPESFMSQMEAYQNGQIDEVQWQGLLSDYDWGVKEQFDKATPISAEMILSSGMNYQIAQENFQRDRGYTPTMFDSQEDYDMALHSYIDSKYGTTYGEKEIKATLASELTTVKHHVMNLADQGYKYDNSYAIDEEGGRGTFKDAFENSDAMIVLDKTIGYNAGYQPHTYKGKTVRTTGAWGTAYQDEIASIIFGDNYNGETGQVDNVKVKDGVFVGGTGGKLGAGHEVGTWTEDATEVGDGDPLTLRGFTIGLKVSGNVDGEYVEYLVIDEPDAEYPDIEKYTQMGLETKQVYLAELYDIDDLLNWTGIAGPDDDFWYGDWGLLADDVYYQEVNFDQVSRELDKKLDINEQLTEQRKKNFNYGQKMKFETQQQKRLQKITNKFLDTYVEGAPEVGEDGIPTTEKIKKKFLPSFDNQLFNLVGPDNDGEYTNLRPHLFSFVLSEAKKRHPDNIEVGVKEITNSLDKYKGTDFGNIIKGGSVDNFYQYLNNNGFDTKELRKEARNIKYVLF